MNSLVGILLKALENDVVITITPGPGGVSYLITDRAHAQEWRRTAHTFTAEELMADLKEGGIPVPAAEQAFNADLQSLLSVRPAPEPTDDDID